MAAERAKATYEPEKKAAFDGWAAHLLAVVEGPREQCDSPARRSMSDPNYLDGEKYIEGYLEIAKKKFERQQGRLADGDASMLADEQVIAGMARVAVIRVYESATDTMQILVTG